MNARLEPSSRAEPGEHAKGSIADAVVAKLLLLCALVPVLSLAGVVGTLVVVGVSGFSGHVSLPHVAVTPDVAALAWATARVAGIAIAVALPLGLLAAIYLNELASPQARRFFLPALETLAVVPTVVYGYFALTAILPVLAWVFPGSRAHELLAMGLAMGLMILPLLASQCVEVFSRVPSSLREGAYALGADKLATVTRVVLPTARAGIGAAVLLAFARAAGEAVIVVLFAGGAEAERPFRVRTVASYIVETFATPGSSQGAGLDLQTLFALGGALLAFTLIFDTLAAKLGRRRAKRAR